MARGTAMLGSEYNWLVSLTRSANGVPQVRMARGSLLTFAVAFFCFLCVVLRAQPAARASVETIDAQSGIIEGLAIHPVTRETFFSDVRQRCIWVRDPSGGQVALKKFSADTDPLLGVFALKFDAAGRTLWASSSAVPEMAGYTAADRGRALLAAYDVGTRRLRRTYPLPSDSRAHVLGDFVSAPDGTIYVTDSLSPVIWRLAAGGERLESWLERADFKSLQGIALSRDQRALYVADYPNGLWRIDLAHRSAIAVSAPAGGNLRGIDGLYAVPGGLIAVQNGTRRQRVLRLTLDDRGNVAQVVELLSGHPAMTDLGLGQFDGKRFQVIANSGWELFANPAATPAPRVVTVLALPAK